MYEISIWIKTWGELYWAGHPARNVRNMKKTLPKGKKTELATGARMAYEKHKVHLWGQLEKFFAEFNGGQSTYTPRTV